MPTTNCPPLVWLPFTSFSRASAGGQLEHPSEVNSSTSTAFCASALVAISARIANATIFRLSMSSLRAHKTHARLESYKPLHIRVPVAHFLVKRGLGQGKSLLQAFTELGFTGQKRGGGRRKLRIILAPGQQPGAGQRRCRAHQLLGSSVQILRI